MLPVCNSSRTSSYNCMNALVTCLTFWSEQQMRPGTNRLGGSKCQCTPARCIQRDKTLQNPTFHWHVGPIRRRDGNGKFHGRMFFSTEDFMRVCCSPHGRSNHPKSPRNTSPRSAENDPHPIAAINGWFQDSCIFWKDNRGPGSLLSPMFLLDLQWVQWPNFSPGYVSHTSQPLQGRSTTSPPKHEKQNPKYTLNFWRKSLS